ncbi:MULTISPECIES: hypothetical protein [unclassified Modicisalibacter]|uniref:hypothetical protein n=1 Tax=unclassified Modicisalibacter TaxID=2679913 RepID=UPI001CCA2909|nr:MULTISPECIES: hypothetical protein [unclassified Modicisalibacter]MBZ9559067.1 hypothetical protein [Modicisalibacter sp. R2A 31.J]MBZ9576822.1 hypothetical protein [Modicisalibacter sp. MOD 31.J]
MSELQIYHAMNVDARQRTLHVLPVLQVDPFDDLAIDDISLAVSVDWLDDPVSPPDGWTIRQPYPNRLYYVGGSDACHLGHFVPLPEGGYEGTVTFHWTVAVVNLPPGHFQVAHRVDLAFAEGEGRTYSMDVANWWSRSEYAEGHANPEIGRNRFSRLKCQGISPARNAHVEESIHEGCRYIDIHESLSLPAITLNDCWTVGTYGGDTALVCLEELR